MTEPHDGGKWVIFHVVVFLVIYALAAILLEMADTRARKRALSIATGVGGIAVEELRNEIE